LFGNKVVAVVGGGNSALDATLQLMKIAKQIYLINNTDQLAGDAIMLQKVQEANHVKILNNYQVSAVLGDKFVRAIKVKNQQQEKELAVEGVFVEIGLIPNSGFVKDVEKNEFNEINIDLRNQTNISGIFAAGDVTNVPEKQIIIAAGEGAKAALGAFRYLAQHKF
jgi:alkyl hydroperoxide reductase subunit F